MIPRYCVSFSNLLAYSLVNFLRLVELSVVQMSKFLKNSSIPNKLIDNSSNFGLVLLILFVYSIKSLNLSKNIFHTPLFNSNYSISSKSCSSFSRFFLNSLIYSQIFSFRVGLQIYLSIFELAWISSVKRLFNCC